MSLSKYQYTETKLFNNLRMSPSLTRPRASPKNHHQPVKLKDQALNHIRLTEPSLAEYDAYILKRRHTDD